MIVLAWRSDILTSVCSRNIYISHLQVHVVAVPVRLGTRIGSLSLLFCMIRLLFSASMLSKNASKADKWTIFQFKKIIIKNVKTEEQTSAVAINV